MVFQTIGDKSNPAILFFHAMGVTGESSMPVAKYLEKKFYCIKTFPVFRTIEVRKID